MFAGLFICLFFLLCFFFISISLCHSLLTFILVIELLHVRCLLFNVLFFVCVYSPTAPSHHTSKCPSISPHPPSMLPCPKCSSTVDQSPEPKGSESQPTPVTNKETLGSHLTTERLGGSVQVLLARGVAF